MSDRGTVNSAPPPRRRVVITGIGAISGFGAGIDPLWEGLCAGRSTIGPVTLFDATPMPSSLAAEVRGVSVKDGLPKFYRKFVKVMARDTELAVIAAADALRHAGIRTRGSGDAAEAIAAGDAQPTYAPARLGCQIGAGLIAADVAELGQAMSAAASEGAFSYEEWGTVRDDGSGGGGGGGGGMDKLTPLWMLKYLPNMLACHVTILHDARGPSNTITCAEASGPLSVGESMRVIERGDADACFAGGVESKLNPMGMLRMDYARYLAHTTDRTIDPERAHELIRPYDADAPGTLVGEGGGIFMLEALDAAHARDAEPIAELLGFGAAHGPMLTTDVGRRADGLERAIRAALRDARIDAADIDAIAPRALGMAAGDAEEAEALRRVFGDRLADVPLLTITPNVGFAVAGAGALQLAAAAQAIRAQTLPARLHAGACPPDLHAGPAETQAATLNRVLVCTGSLGGQNAALVLGKPDTT